MTEKKTAAERLPPLYHTVIAYGPYPKHYEFRPVGVYKEALLARKVIAPGPAPVRVPPPSAPDLDLMPRGRQQRRGHA